jgi:hypothetical protein
MCSAFLVLAFLSMVRTIGVRDYRIALRWYALLDVSRVVRPESVGGKDTKVESVGFQKHTRPRASFWVRRKV